MEHRRYKFKTKGKGPSSYTKREEDLSPKELTLLLQDLLTHYKNSPEAVKGYFINMIAKQLEKARNEQNKSTENDQVQSGETKVEST